MDLKQALLLILSGIGGTLGFSLIFRMRKRLIVWALLGAAVTLGVYVLCLATLQHAFFQNLFPALVGALFAEITAKLTKSPATQYLACAIIPLVPGGGLYYTMYHFVTGDMEAFLAAAEQYRLHPTAVTLAKYTDTFTTVVKDRKVYVFIGDAAKNTVINRSHADTVVADAVLPEE